jgi:ssDNA-specific exonuclease RecJ
MSLIVASVLVDRDGKKVIGTLPHETALNIKEAVEAIQASGGVSLVEADLANDLRRVITDAVINDNKFDVQDIKNINQATALLKASANPAKETRTK